MAENQKSSNHLHIVLAVLGLVVGFGVVRHFHHAKCAQSKLSGNVSNAYSVDYPYYISLDISGITTGGAKLANPVGGNVIYCNANATVSDVLQASFAPNSLINSFLTLGGAQNPLAGVPLYVNGYSTTGATITNGTATAPATATPGTSSINKNTTCSSLLPSTLNFNTGFVTLTVASGAGMGAANSWVTVQAAKK